MLNHISRTHVVGFWSSAAVLVIAGAMVVRVDPGVAVSAAPLLLTVALITPAVVRLLQRGTRAIGFAERLPVVATGAQPSHS